MLMCSAASSSQTWASAPTWLRSSTSSTSVSPSGVPRPRSACRVLARSLVTTRRTLCSWLSMTVMARMLTLSRARADRTLARRPGLFSRKTETCLAVCIADSSTVDNPAAGATAAAEQRRAPHIAPHCKSRRGAVQQKVAPAAVGEGDASGPLLRGVWARTPDAEGGFSFQYVARGSWNETNPPGLNYCTQPGHTQGQPAALPPPGQPGPAVHLHLPHDLAGPVQLDDAAGPHAADEGVAVRQALGAVGILDRGLPQLLAVGVILLEGVAVRDQHAVAGQELDAADGVAAGEPHLDARQLPAPGVIAPPALVSPHHRNLAVGVAPGRPAFDVDGENLLALAVHLDHPAGGGDEGVAVGKALGLEGGGDFLHPQHLA